ncbi:MAG: hypothetical protein GXP54_03540 [Deltaproteobacteria bacterium]|nr:hypothetical protein [Deltaproteobacteria bacterium]
MKPWIYYTTAMEGRNENARLLADVARDLAEAIDEGRVSRPARPDARALLMEAWLKVSAEDETETPDLRRLIRAIDDILVASMHGKKTSNKEPSSRMQFKTLIGREPAPVAVTAADDWSSRVERIEKYIQDVLRRTLDMVQNVEEDARVPRSFDLYPGAGNKPSERDVLELVRGDSEE